MYEWNPLPKPWKYEEHLGCVGSGSKLLMACAWGTDLSGIIGNHRWEAWKDAFYSLIYFMQNARSVCPAPEWAGDWGDTLWTLSPWGIQRLGLTFPSENPLGLDCTIFCLGSECLFRDHHPHVLHGQCFGNGKSALNYQVYAKFAQSSAIGKTSMSKGSSSDQTAQLFLCDAA